MATDASMSGVLRGAGSGGPAAARWWLAAVALCITALVASACGDDGEGADGSDAPSGTDASSATLEAADELVILVSNDDGIDAPGIAALSDALAAMEDTSVVVVAPAENQSGSGSSTTDGELSSTPAETATGREAIAVDGTPADSVNWALDGGIDVTPDVVVTGVNSGQNLGALGDEISGTVGAARAAAARDIPALASSTSLSDDADYSLAAGFAVDWVRENRDALLAGELTGDDLLLENLNVPTCVEGELRGPVDVPMATTTDGAIEEQDCVTEPRETTDDIVAFNDGYVTVSVLTLEPRT